MTDRPLEATQIAGGKEVDVAVDRYDGMLYRRAGRSGLMLPAISLGAWLTFGGYRDVSVARACLRLAFDLGITHFDFANNYGTHQARRRSFAARSSVVTCHVTS